MASKEIAPAPDPADCCELLQGLPYLLFLDSATSGTPLGRYSFLMADPIAVVRSKGAVTEIVELADSLRQACAEGERPAPERRPAPAGHHIYTNGDALDAVRMLLAPHRVEPIPGLPPFQGGAAGYLAYDWGGVLERVPSPRHDDLALPDVVFGIYDWVIAWDHDASRAWLVSTGLPEDRPDRRAVRAHERANAVEQLLLTRVNREDTCIDASAVGRRPRSVPGWFPPAPLADHQHKCLPGLDRPRSNLESSAWVAGRSTGKRDRVPTFLVENGWWNPNLAIRSSFTHRDYVDAVARVREYIFAGDIFQANLSQRFEVPLGEPPWALYRRLRARNPAPFAAYFDFPDAVVLSTSPERFLRVDVTGQVETRPIKGTRPRGLGPEHDAALAVVLTESAKDRAENLMIVDLMRNDLSRVCAPGTVRVSDLFALEHYATVHHLVSTVVGELAEGHDALDLLRAAFPGGSITGAPKVRAMEIIAELEPSERGVYCGSIGYWSVTGALDTSIAIRTAVAAGGRVSFSAGGGIVADSEPEQEYWETLDKARGIINALAAPV